MKVFYDGNVKRLVYIGGQPTPDFWDKHWNSRNLKEDIERSKEDRFVLKILDKYVPDKKGKILEGGCGRGHVVYCMQTHGYECVGVDFAAETIKKIKEVMPELNVRVADVRDLPFPDNYFTAYWSFGVIEHFWDGYHDVLREMKRVLTNSGYVFLTFPYISPLRRLKTKLGLYRDIGELSEGERESFYQFALNAETVIEDFEAIGFKLLEKKSISGIKGFKDEVSPFKPLLQRLFDYEGENLLFMGTSYGLDKLLATFAGHMVFMVFQNTH
jgi:ubiquinone/menaquinone biosynthesis C-methylase UbiE